MVEGRPAQSSLGNITVIDGAGVGLSGFDGPRDIENVELGKLADSFQHRMINSRIALGLSSVDDVVDCLLFSWNWPG